MTREIKFRAWDRELKGWIVEWVNFAEGKAFVLRGNRMVELTNADVVQFTGLKDKNGREIYEGDIIAFTDDDGAQGAPYEVKDIWEVPKLRVRMPYWKNFVVIGNIYENPELLK